MSERTYYVLCADNCKFEGMTKTQTLAAIDYAMEHGELPSEYESLDVAGVIHYDHAQTLTNAEKIQARTNIGAIDSTSVPTSISDLEFDITVPVVFGGTGATTKAQALSNLGGVSMENLWVNASYRSSFAPQTITISGLSDYKVVVVICTRSTTNTDGVPPTILTAQNVNGQAFTQNDSGIGGARCFVRTASGVTVADCYVEGTVDNSYCIPYQILGIK